MTGYDPNEAKDESLAAIERWYREALKPINDEYYAKKAALAAEFETRRKPITDEYFARRRALRDERNHTLTPKEKP